MVNSGNIGYFLGEYRHNLTEKNRLSLPKKFRLEIDGSEIILSRGDEGCIEGFDKNKWKEMVREHLTIPFTEERGRQIRRRVFGSAMLAEIDRQGRIVVPDTYLSWAELKGKIGEEVVIVGVGDHFEIWEKQKWEEKNKVGIKNF